MTSYDVAEGNLEATRGEIKVGMGFRKDGLLDEGSSLCFLLPQEYQKTFKKIEEEK